MYIGNASAIWWRQGWKKKKKMKNIKWWPRCSRSDPKFGHDIVGPMVSVSWRILLSDISCVPSRHQHDKERRNEVQVQDKPSWRDHMIEACHPYGDHGYVKICLKESLSHRSMGEQLSGLHQASAIKKGVPSWGEQDHHHQAQVEYAQCKGMILIAFIFYRSRGASCETGL